MSRNRIQTLPIAAFPLLLAIGIVTIPVVADYANHTLAEEGARQAARWYAGHLLSALAFGVGALASCSIAAFTDRLGQGLDWIGLPLAVVGAALYAAGLGADGVGPVAIANAGGQPRTFFDGSGMLVSGVFIAGAVSFGTGAIIQVMRVVHAVALGSALRYVISIAALAMAAAPVMPSGWGLYGVAAAALVVYLPISALVWRDPAPVQPAQG